MVCRISAELRQLHSHLAAPTIWLPVVAEALEAREGLRETDKKETRLFIQTHPDVLIIPPDPPQMMIKVDQVRQGDREHLLSARGRPKKRFSSLPIRHS